MVNALLCDLPSIQSNQEEIDLVIDYAQQLHFLHGFRTIFLPENIQKRIQARKRQMNDYIKRLPRFHSNLEMLVERIRQELDSILWKLKRTEHVEAQLSSFVSLYSKWVHALSLEAVVVLPMMVPTGSVCHFFHILVGDKRQFIGPLADDLELWFLSHFADVPIKWPYYLDFSRQIKESFATRFNLDQFQDLRTKICFYPANKQEVQTRKRLLQRALESNKLIMEFSTTNYRDNIILTPSAMGVSNRNLLSLERSQWNYTKLMTMLQEPVSKGKGFAPCFVPDKLYSMELIRRIQPLGSLGNATNPLNYYEAFELACDRNVDLALENFEKRLGIKRTS